MHHQTTHHHSSRSSTPHSPHLFSIPSSVHLLRDRRKPKPRPRRVKHAQIRIKKHIPINILTASPDTLQTPKTTTSARTPEIYQAAWNRSIGCAADLETVGWERGAAGEDVAALRGGIFCS